MNMISAQVQSDCIGCEDEDDNSHDATLSHGVIKLCLCFFECTPSSSKNLHIVP